MSKVGSIFNFGGGGTPSQGHGQLGMGQNIQDVGEPTGLDKLDCTDTDGGLSFAAAGSVFGKVNRDTEESTTFTDKCMDDSKTLIEYYCNPWSGLVKFHKIYCKSGCQETAGGGKCSNNPFCINTDTEKNPGVKGSVILIKANEEDLPEGSIGLLAAKDMVEIVQDFCDETDKSKVIQHSCDLSSAGYSEIVSACEAGKECMNGICRVPIATPQTKAAPEGLVGNIKSFFGSGPKIAASALPAGDGSVECEVGSTTTVNGIQVACFGDRLVFSLRLKAGFNKMLNVNLGDAQDSNDPPSPFL